MGCPVSRLPQNPERADKPVFARTGRSWPAPLDAAQCGLRSRLRHQSLSLRRVATPPPWLPLKYRRLQVSSSQSCNPSASAAVSPPPSPPPANSCSAGALLPPASSDRNGDNAFSSLAVSPQVTDKIASAIDHSEKPGRHPKQGPPFFMANTT